MTQFSNLESMASVRVKINEAIQEVDRIKNQTGWANYQDTQYTTESPFSINVATATKIPNNGQSTQVQELPEDYATSGLYNVSTQKIIGMSGDSLIVTPEFKIRRSSGNGAFDIDVYFDIGGAIPPIYRNTIQLRGSGDQNVTFSQGVYTLDTWESNGADIYIVPSVSVDIYDIRFVVHRLHKGRGSYGV